MFTVKELRVLAATFDALDYKLPATADLQKISQAWRPKTTSEKNEKKETICPMDNSVQWFSLYDYILI